MERDRFVVAFVRDHIKWAGLAPPAPAWSVVAEQPLRVQRL